LTNVGSPVSESRLVLQLVAGLTPAYDGVATFIQQTVPLPPFYQATSMLALEESRKKKQTEANVSSPAALVAATTPTTSPSLNSSPKQSSYSSPSNRGSVRGRGGRFHRGGRNRGGRSSRGGFSGQYLTPPPQWKQYWQ